MITDIKKLTVKYNGKTVGYLAQIDEGIAFQYDEKWLKNGFNISPFSLPLEDRVALPACERREVRPNCRADNRQKHRTDPRICPFY